MPLSKADNTAVFVDQNGVKILKKYIDDSIANIDISAGEMIIRALTNEEIEAILV